MPKRMMSPNLMNLVEDIEDLANHIRKNYAWHAMTVEEFEAFMTVYAKLVDMWGDLGQYGYLPE